MNLNYYDPNSANSLQALQNTLSDSISKLDQLRNMNLQPANNTPKAGPVEQRYYLDCGNKNDWQEFLAVNYGISESDIFDDYKLFLQAKAELKEDSNKERLENMKSKLSTNKEKQLSKASEKAIANYKENINGANVSNNGDTNSSRTNNNQYTGNAIRNDNKGVKHVR